MSRLIRLLALILILACALPAHAEDIMEKGKPTAAPTSAPSSEIKSQGSSNTQTKSAVITKKNSIISKNTATSRPTATPTTAPTAASQNIVIVHSRATAVPQPTATPIPAALAADYVQDPVSFSEGKAQFYANNDNAYCKRRDYKVTVGSAVEFAKAYADMCKNHPSMTYLESSSSPTGWNYYCFAAAAGKNYTAFTTSSGDWSTGSLCLSISFKEDSQYITLRWSHELNMGDLGHRISSPAPVVNTQTTASADQLETLKEIWLSDNQYYYNQLSDAHKQAFEICISNVLNYPNQTSANKDYHLKALARMIKVDNPRIFWVDWIDFNGLLRYDTRDSAHYDGPQLPEGKTLADLQQTFLAAIPNAVSQIEKSLPPNASTRDTIKAIHDWLCKNNRYNYSQMNENKADFDPVSFDFLAAHSAYSAMIPGDAYEPVCSGYACAFHILCEEFGIDAINVSGEGNRANHEWNYVKMDDGQWYLVDVTWDDQSSSYTHNYFLLNAAQTAQKPYAPDPYIFSGVKPENGYSEGAAFEVPALAK